MHENTKLLKDAFAQEDKIAQKQFCTRSGNCTKIFLHEGTKLYEYTFAQRQFCMKSHFCTEKLLLEQAILYGDIFARVDIFS